jgi:hypothetical protein
MAPHRQITRLVPAAIVCLLAACADDPVTAPASSTSIPPSRANPATLDSVARALALALDIRENRVLLKDALRASRFTEHKLELQEFAKTSIGKRLLDQAAIAARIPSATFEGMLGRLPQLDLYVPSRETRRTWTGADGLVVFATLKPARDGFGYRGDGSRVAMDAAFGASRTPMVFLHPAEPKGVRMDPQRNRPGAVIQEANDGEMGVSYVDVAPDGSIIERHLTTAAQLELPREMVMAGRGGHTITDLRPLNLEPCDETTIYCDEEPPPPPPPPSEPPASVMLGSLWTIDACDYNCAFTMNDQLELEFKTWMRGWEYKTKWYGVGTNHAYMDKELPIRPEIPVGSEYVHIQVWESDYGGDDHWITQDLSAHEVVTGWVSGGNVRCDFGPLPWEHGATWPQEDDEEKEIKWGAKVDLTPRVLCFYPFRFAEVNAQFWLRPGPDPVYFDEVTDEDRSTAQLSNPPNCADEPNWPYDRIHGPARSWCRGEVIKGAFLRRYQRAVRDIRNKGTPACIEIAAALETLLITRDRVNNQRTVVRVFNYDEHLWRGVAPPDNTPFESAWMGISKAVIRHLHNKSAHYYDPKRGNRRVHINLTRVMAHEGDHIINNAAHIFEPAFGLEDRQLTRYTRECMNDPSPG